MHERKIPYYKPTGGKVLFLSSDIEAFIKRGKKASARELSDQATTVLEQLNNSCRATFKKPVKAKKDNRGLTASTRSTPCGLASRIVA